MGAHVTSQQNPHSQIIFQFPEALECKNNNNSQTTRNELRGRV